MFFYLITEGLGFHLLQSFFHRLPQQSSKEPRPLSNRLHNGNLRLKGQVIHFTPDAIFPGNGIEEIFIAAKTFQFRVLLCGKSPLTVPNCLTEHVIRHAAAKLDDFRRRKAYSLIQRPLHQTRSNLLIEEFIGYFNNLCG